MQNQNINDKQSGPISEPEDNSSKSMSGPRPHNSAKSADARAIRAIAVFKFIKVVLLCSLGIGAFGLLNPVVGEKLTHWVGSFAWSYNHGFVLSALAKLTGLSPVQMKELGIGAFFYATFFFIEGLGLWAGRRWAEYLTLIATGSFLPIELYELFKRPTIPRGTALLLNIIIIIYLLYVVRHQAGSRKSGLVKE
jgi:uncharacterized membrane protein (DUF2068 family)